MEAIFEVKKEKYFFFFFSSRRRHTRLQGDWSSDVCSSDLARMTLQVHDELVLEVPETEVPAVSRIVRNVMEGVHELRVPLVADLKIGPNWLDMTKVESKD